MSIKVNIEINVAAEGYTEHESAILAALAAHPSQGTAAVIPALPSSAGNPQEAIDMTARTKEAADARIAEAKAKAAAEAKAKADAAAKTKAAADAKVAAAKAAVEEAEAAVAAEAAEEPVEDLVGGDTDEATYTLEDAVAKATGLVSSGRAAEVKSALAQTSAKKVSELKGADLNTFMTVLGA
jgi:hypothetical protein